MLRKSESPRSSAELVLEFKRYTLKLSDHSRSRGDNFIWLTSIVTTLVVIISTCVRIIIEAVGAALIV